MKITLDIIKGIHPGKLVERELKKRNINQRQFALSMNEHPQTLGAIINGKRSMNLGLSLKIEEKLGFEEGLLMTLQVYNDIKNIKHDANFLPDLSKLRKGLFWDTNIQKIDWDSQKKAVINRVFSRGNEEEKEEITRFYGSAIIDKFQTLTS